MNKFKLLYNVILDVWNIISIHIDEKLNDATCETIIKELNDSLSKYHGKERKLASTIFTTIVSYLYDTNF